MILPGCNLESASNRSPLKHHKWTHFEHEWPRLLRYIWSAAEMLVDTERLKTVENALSSDGQLKWPGSMSCSINHSHHEPPSF